MHKSEHAKHVDAWLESAAKGIRPQDLPGLFAAAWAALWRRAESAVGALALESIARLVQARAAERYPFLSALKLGSSEVSGATILDSAAPDAGRAREGLGFMLTELISVIGDLTDEVLTPGLYAELSRLKPTLPPAAPHEKDTLKEIVMKSNNLISTGIRNLDEMLDGGLVAGSSTAIVGPPGSGKTILAQQIAFHNASPKSPVLFFSTLSEPGAKTLFYLSKFAYFDRKKFETSVQFVDLGSLLRTKGLQETLEIILGRLNEAKPSLVVIDSFKVFVDMAASKEDLRKFSYELIINLITRNCTSLFLGEYDTADFDANPLFSIIDGLITMTQRDIAGEQQRLIQIVKMRGLAHSRDEYTFRINSQGVEIFAPRFSIQRAVPSEFARGETPHLKVGIEKLDDLLGGGIPRGSSLLISGVAGTGKTVLGMEFIYRGALAGEKGIIFSFEETEARLRAEARGMGWDLDAEIEKGMVKIFFVPQPEILIEQHLVMIHEQIAAMGAARVAIDSLSVFLYKLKDPQVLREKVFQLAGIVQNAGAVAFFATDIPYGTSQISRFGVEETVVDGVIILSSTEEGLERQRYLEVYKLRNTAHLKGRHSMKIESGGIQIYPRYWDLERELNAPPPAKLQKRLSTGNGSLDKLIGSGLMAQSATLISGSSGIGKSILALQFLLEGAAKGESGLYVTLEEGPDELQANAAALGLPLRQAVDDGLVEVIYLPPTHIRSTQLLTLLTDKIKDRKASRMVLDSTTHIVASGMSRDNIRELLYDLVVRTKSLGVTSVFTLESDSMFSRETGTDSDRGFTPLADNIIVLRYVPSGSKVVSSLMVVKTRGSNHDSGHYSFAIGHGGIRLGGPIKMFSRHEEQPAAAVAAGRKH